MKKMKKNKKKSVKGILLLMALAVLGSLTACGNNEQVTKEQVFEVSDDSEPVTATDTVIAE